MPSPFGITFDPIGNFFGFLSQFDTGLKLGNLFNAASNEDEAAKIYVSYIVHEAGRDVLQKISDTSSTMTLTFLAVGAPEAAGVSSCVGLVADIGLAIDDALSGNYKEAGISAVMIVAGAGVSQSVKTGLNSVIEKGLKISVGSNGQFYSLRRRGAMKTWDAMNALLKADIATGKFGDMAPELSSQMINLAKKAYDALQE
jgi:hypothetical protein